MESVLERNGLGDATGLPEGKLQGLDDKLYYAVKQPRHYNA